MIEEGMFILCADPTDPYALGLSGELKLPLADRLSDEDRGRLHLQLDEDGLSLRKGEYVLKGDYSGKIRRLKHDNLSHEFLIKAAKPGNDPRGLRAVDATAGLGEDALLLAAAGYAVDLYERDAIIAALLADTLRRAERIPELAPIVERMHVIKGDSITALPKLCYTPDLVLLDPMFPARTKSALVKKKFQLIHLLEAPCTDEEELLGAALAAKPRKLIIKRPPKGPYLGGRKPAYSITGKAVRYDVII